MWSNRFVADTGWEDVTIVSRGRAIRTHARLAGDNEGNAGVVWNESDGANSTVWSNQYTVNDGWNNPERIEPDTSGTTEYPFVAMNALGEAVATWRWSDDDNFRHNLKINRFLPGSGWVGAETIQEGASSYNTQPAPIINSAGEVIVAWSSQAGIRTRTHTNDNGWGEPESVANRGRGTDSVQLFIGNGGDVMSVVRQNDSGPTNKTSYSFQIAY